MTLVETICLVRAHEIAGELGSTFHSKITAIRMVRDVAHNFRIAGIKAHESMDLETLQDAKNWV